jgi:hypothetical protein
MNQLNNKRTRAQEARAAIERLYIAMKHLFIRGSYKPLGISGEGLIESLMTLRPEIYGSIADPERVELDGLMYIFERLPKGIEECRFIKLISREGYETSSFTPLEAGKRRRDCYRVDDEQMFIEVTRGRSDIYDILTHLTFMYVEAEKIRKNSIDRKGRIKREWEMLCDIIDLQRRGESFNKEVAYTYLSSILGRTFQETLEASQKFETNKHVNSLFHIVYHLGKISFAENLESKDREVSFSSALREKIGHHVYSEQWAHKIKMVLHQHDLLNRPIHIISANTHSVMNTIYAPAVLKEEIPLDNIIDLAQELSLEKNKTLSKRVKKHALENGMYEIEDTSGTSLTVQVFDSAAFGKKTVSKAYYQNLPNELSKKPVILVMDYAFGEQAFETMDELLKPFEFENESLPLQIESISIMGKAGILKGRKGDIMIPNGHVFEGTADNYPFKNDLCREDFSEIEGIVCDGPMITVLGTSLQNREILKFFFRSSWQIIGLEMEGAHYQKAIQAASKIRKSIKEDITVRYAYYASDNPMISGQTLASGSLGLVGVKPTYLITEKILNKIFK